MNILLMTNYFAPDAGAAAVRLTRLAKQFAARGHTVTVLTAMPHYPHGKIPPVYRGKFSVTDVVNGVRVVRVWLWTTPDSRISRRLISQLTLMVTLLIRGLRLPRPEVVLLEAQPMFTNFAGTLLSRFKRVPCVQNVSDLWPDHLLSVGTLTEHHPLYRLLRGLTDATYRQAAAIIALSPAWAAAIRRYVHEPPASQRIQVVYNGVDPRLFAAHDPTNALAVQAFRERYGAGDARLVMFIGALTTQNDFETMLAVAERLQARSDVRFVIVGDGAQGQGLRDRLMQQPLPNVRLTGWIDHSDIPAAWGAAAVLMLALRAEPLYAGTVPAKFIEAMAAGVPVAAAVHGEAARLITESGAGIAVACGDVDGLTLAVAALLDDPSQAAAARAAGQAYARLHFDPEQVADTYLQVFLKIVNKG